MTDTNEDRDIIGKVIRKDDADRAKVHAAIPLITKVKNCLIRCKATAGITARPDCSATRRFVGNQVHGGTMSTEPAYVVELRQQLADVSHERDLLRALLKRVIDSSVLAFEQDAPEDIERLEADVCAAVKPSAEVKS